jgi:hypothetical protein
MDAKIDAARDVCLIARFNERSVSMSILIPVIDSEWTLSVAIVGRHVQAAQTQVSSGTESPNRNVEAKEA